MIIGFTIFLILFLILLLFGVLGVVFYPLGLFSPVTSLPFGMEEVLQQAVGYIHGLITVMPFMAIIWQGIVLYATIAFVLWVVNLFLGLFFNRRM